VLVAEGGSIDAAGPDPTDAFLQLVDRAKTLLALLRQGLIVKGNSIIGASVAHAMDHMRDALSKPEFGIPWLTGGAPRLLLPHCGPADFTQGQSFEGVVRPQEPLHWLGQLLRRLPRPSFLNLALRSESFPVDGCELDDGMGTFQDPTCVVGIAGDWDTLVVKRDMFGCSGEIPCLRGVTFFARAGSMRRSIKFNRHETEALLQDRGIDALFLSAGAGNCAELQQTLRFRVELPKVVVVTINPLLAPPIRIIPNYVLALAKLAENNESSPLRRLAVQCSLQATIDLLAPQFSLLFVDGARAIFVNREVAHLFGEVASPFELWRRGATCTLAGAELVQDRPHPIQAAASLGVAEWPCQELNALGLPRWDHSDPINEALICRSAAVEAPASVRPYHPGLATLLQGRGHCFWKEEFCECFPPWRGMSCDRKEKEVAEGRAIATMLQPGGEDELHHSLQNWWANFNRKLDQPVIIFYAEAFSSGVAALLSSTPNRVWFAFVGPDFLAAARGEEASAAAAWCRFKFASIFEHQMLLNIAWLTWLDAGFRFEKPVVRDLVEQTTSTGAVLGFLGGPVAAERPPPALRHLTLLFAAAEEQERPDDDFVSPFPKFGEGPMAFVAVSNQLLVMSRDAFRSGVLKRFADWTAEFAKEEPLCRWGDALLRSVQASILSPSKRQLLLLE